MLGKIQGKDTKIKMTTRNYVAELLKIIISNGRFCDDVKRVLDAPLSHTTRRSRDISWHIEGGDSDNRLSIIAVMGEYSVGVLSMAEFDIKKLAVPSVCLLISFLAYPPQVLFVYLDPSPLTRAEILKFNILVLCIWVSYYRACKTNPGDIPSAWVPKVSGDGEKQEEKSEIGSERIRWCRRCDRLKPPRAHHCKACGRSVLSKPSRSLLTCERCIPKMDHHCPWTSNCVSHFTFPHFIRFLFYAVVSMLYLEYFIYIRGAVIWDNRSRPSVRHAVF